MYRLAKNSFGQVVVIKTNGNALISFLEDPANTDYAEYLKWLAEGNTPLPADAQPE
jgi:hypothetical protein